MEIFIGIILFIGLWYWLNNLDKRLKLLEEVKGPGYSHWFRVNAYSAAIERVLETTGLTKITKIKSAIAGKPYKKWTKEEQTKFDTLLHEYDFEKKLYVTITYLQSENAYFVRSQDNSTYIKHRESNTNVIYSTTVFGDQNSDHLEFTLYERLVKLGTTNQWVLTPCLEYHDGHFSSDKKDFVQLFDLPILENQYNDDYFQKLGFEVDRSDGDIYEDDFGQNQSSPTFIEYTKNGVTVQYVL